MKESVKKVLDRVSREPVLGFAAIEAYLIAYHEAWFNTDLKKAFLTAAMLWLTRTFSTSKKTAEENVDAAKYVGAIESQAQLGAQPGEEPEAG